MDKKKADKYFIYPLNPTKKKLKRYDVLNYKK